MENQDDLKKQVEHIISAYKQPALIEEFIAGSEFTVAVVGNDPAQAMPVVQIKIDGRLQLKDKFYTSARITSNRLEYICPARIPQDLNKKITELAVRTYNAVECKDFGRIDFRVDSEGNPFVLEINPLPSLSTEDVFMVVAKEIRISYAEMIGKILDSAIKRYSLN